MRCSHPGNGTNVKPDPSHAKLNFSHGEQVIVLSMYIFAMIGQGGGGLVLVSIYELCIIRSVQNSSKKISLNFLLFI